MINGLGFNLDRKMDSEKERMKDWFIGLLISGIAVFDPIRGMIVVATLLIVTDWITGVLAARKKGQQITSAGHRRTISKFGIYLVAIGLGFLVEVYMIAEIIPISKLIAGAVSIVELKSILENLDVINGSSLFKSIIKKLGSVNDSE
jgi:hypothetical protein